MRKSRRQRTQGFVQAVEAETAPQTDQVLSPRQLRGIDLLANGYGVSQVAEVVGVCRQQVWVWKRQEAFQEGLERRREELWGEIKVPLVEGTRASIKELIKILSEKDEDGDDVYPEEAQLEAAKILLGISSKMLGVGRS